MVFVVPLLGWWWCSLCPFGVVVVFVVSGFVDTRWRCAGVRVCGGLGCGCWRGRACECFFFIIFFLIFYVISSERDVRQGSLEVSAVMGNLRNNCTVENEQDRSSRRSRVRSKGQVLKWHRVTLGIWKRRGNVTTRWSWGETPATLSEKS